MQDCTSCPDKEYCIPDECLGTKKMPSRTAMRKGHIEKYPFKVYHIVKPKAKGEFKAFLDSIGAEKVTSATDEQRIQIMEWVNSRG